MSSLPDGIALDFEQEKDRVYDKLEKHLELLEEDGKRMESIRMRENGVFAGREHFGKAHPLVQEAVQTLVLKCNSFAMQFLPTESTRDEAKELLTIADQHTSAAGYITDNQRRLNLRSVTMNNFGCFYKSIGKLHTAVQYMEKALKIESTTPECENPAGTHLNVCAILSELGRHRAAADHAKCAIQLLKYQKALIETDVDDTATEDGPLSCDDVVEKASTSVLAIAYFNWGVELEHLKRYSAAVSSYTSARTIATEELEPDNAFLKTIQAALTQASQKIHINPRKINIPISPRACSPRTLRINN